MSWFCFSRAAAPDGPLQVGDPPKHRQGATRVGPDQRPPSSQNHQGLSRLQGHDPGPRDSCPQS